MRQFFGAVCRASPALRSSQPGSRIAQTRELATKGELLDRVAAIVNDGVVLNSELDEQMALITERLREQKLELPPQNVLRQQVLERLVLQEIQMQHAEQRRRQGLGRERSTARCRTSRSATT